jgi:hypothetical protein
MMHVYGLRKEPVRLVEGASKRGRFSIDATCCQNAVHLIRKAQARRREALLEAIGAAISALSAHAAGGFFEHCGYRVGVQPL